SGLGFFSSAGFGLTSGFLSGSCDTPSGLTSGSFSWVFFWGWTGAFGDWYASDASISIMSLTIGLWSSGHCSGHSQSFLQSLSSTMPMPSAMVITTVPVAATAWIALSFMSL